MNTGAEQMAKALKKTMKTKNKLSTFTYFIPAPPNRKTGYREREFDKILTGILQSGFQIESLQTQSVQYDGAAGLFIIALLKAPSAKVAALDHNQDIQERFRLSNTHSSPEIMLEEDEFRDDF